VTPAEFVRARLDEDEATAREADGSDWWNESGVVHAIGGNNVHPLTDRWGDGRNADQAARHDPARVLREVAALRAMVDKDEGAASEYGDGSELSGYGDTGYTVWRAHFTMCTLAAIWSDHPDYDPAWAE
jgi:hypothetical protein